MSEGEKACKYSVMCAAHYCVFEDRNLLLSEPEVHAKNSGRIHDATQVVFLTSALSFVSKLYAVNSPTVMINLNNISVLIASRSN